MSKDAHGTSSSLGIGWDAHDAWAYRRSSLAPRNSVTRIVRSVVQASPTRQLITNPILQLPTKLRHQHRTVAGLEGRRLVVDGHELRGHLGRGDHLLSANVTS